MGLGVEELVRAAGRRNTAIFARCWREGVEPAAHQYDMAERIDGDSAYQADFWPRDHGKSEIFCISYPLRRIAEDPNIRILLVQKTATEAEKTLGVIKRELESNTRLKRFYAGHWQEAVGQRDISNALGQVEESGEREGAWQQSRIYVKRTRRGKDPTVEAVGVGGAITGGHYDVIILDDVEDDENTKTDERLRSMVAWFTGTIMQLREPHTKMVIVGTLKTNRQDIYNLVLASPVWDTFTCGAILSHSLEQIAYTPQRDAQGVVRSVTVQTPGVKTLWPQKWPIAALLLEMLASLDVAIWIREKCNDLKALQGKVFSREKFGWFDEEMLAAIRLGGGFERLIQMWDTAYEERRSSDWSVCVTAGLWQGKIYILEVYRARLTLPKLRLAIEAQFATWKPEEIGIEDIGSGKSGIQVLESETGLPIARIDPEGRDKVARARSATIYLDAGRILLRSGMTWLPLFLSEVSMFPDDAHDDQVDALVYAVLRLMLGAGKRKVAGARSRA